MTRRERLMVIDYWRRVLRGERDPLKGVMRRFKLSTKQVLKFFVRLEIYEMSETRH